MSLIEYGKNRQRWEAPSPELIAVGEDYSLSINPEEQYFGFKGQARWQRCYQYLHELISFHPNKICSIKLHLEISKNGRIHGHGIIAIYDIAYFYMDVLPYWQRFCTYEIDTIQSPNTWFTYMNKSNHLLARFNTEMSNGQCFAVIRRKRSEIDQKYIGIDITALYKTAESPITVTQRVPLTSAEESTGEI